MATFTLLPGSHGKRRIQPGAGVVLEAVACWLRRNDRSAHMSRPTRHRFIRDRNLDARHLTICCPGGSQTIALPKDAPEITMTGQGRSVPKLVANKLGPGLLSSCAVAAARPGLARHNAFPAQFSKFLGFGTCDLCLRRAEAWPDCRLRDIVNLMSRPRRKDWHSVRKGACVWIFRRCEGAAR